MCAALLRASSTIPSSLSRPRQLETAAAGSGGSGRSRTSSNPPRTREPLRPSPKRSLRMGADDLEPEVAGSPHQKKAKTSKDTMLVRSPLPWLRSGRSFTHALVVEAATIQVEALSAFQLVPLDPAHKTQSVVSSQRTVTEPSSPASPTPTHGTTEAFASPSPCSSQATTVGP
ncbi:hypothetical protein PF006_g20881 [Phytophthora fragariae]|uniref:Uncharacterized protein n=2 Tax=Phytophthora fragariae TaxID=53985 RepID=A0A6A3S3T1_9STRA|nr:hypothetical protein PF006_g20881 [Phytophthora fragariae]